MEREFKIAALIQRYISGEASEEEKRDVKEWMACNPKHELMMERFCSESFLPEQEAEYEVFDLNRAFERFLKDKRRMMRRRMIYRVSGVAAAILIVLGVGMYAWMGMTEVRVEEPRVAQVLRPGGSKAILVLGGGEKVLLHDSMHMELKEQLAKIEVAGDQVRYLNDECYADSVVKNPVMNKIMTTRGGEYKLTLSDGTRVWVNADSRLEFPAKFTGARREVYMEGEVYFEVMKDAAHPFVVHTRSAKVRVLGTSFNVRAYPDEVNRTTLIEGSVEIERDNETVRLQPAEQWVFDGEKGKVIPANTRVAMSWKNGCFAFDDAAMPDVFQELERWYDVHVFVANESVKEFMFTGIFPRYENLDKVLEIIEMATGVSFTINDRTIVVSKVDNKSGK